MSPAEVAAWRAKAAAAGVPLSDLLRRAMARTRTRTATTAEVDRERTRQVARIGNNGFVMQPGMGVDVNVWRRFTLRLAADLPILAGGDYIVPRPKLSARLVVALGR